MPADFKEDRLKIFIAFSAIYILWGSTYLANKFAIETVPPFIMTGLRFTAAGLVLMLFLKLRGEKIPALKEWKHAFIIGGFMLFICNGFTAVAQQKVPSGLTALYISITPLYMTLVNWLFNKDEKPTVLEITGILIGFFGMFLLVHSNTTQPSENIDPFSIFLVLVSPLAWVIGSIYSKKVHENNSSFMPIAMQMLCGGFLLLFFSIFRNEWPNFVLAAVTYKSIFSILYLIIGGSLIGYSAYIWLLKKCPPTLVSTNTFINPVIALILGTTLAGEFLSFKMIIASVVIISSVLIITLSHLRNRK